MMMKRLSEIMMKNGVRDFVFDTLIRYRIPDWESHGIYRISGINN